MRAQIGYVCFRLARQHLQASSAGLPSVWLLKIMVALTQPELPPHLRSLYLGYMGDLVEVMAVWAELEGVQEARRQLLLLALQLLRDDQLMATPQQVEALLHALPPLFQGDAAEEACAQACGFIRPTESADLLPYRLTLLCKALRSCLSLPSERRPKPLLQALLTCPFSRKLLRASPDHAPLISILSEHDDLLLESLNDWLVVAALLRGSGLPWAGPMLRESDPLSMLSAFLGTLACDEGVLLDMLLSGDTCILEYLIRWV